MVLYRPFEYFFLMAMRKAEFEDSEAIRYIASNAGYIDYISSNLNSMIQSENLFVYVDDGKIKGFFSLEDTGQMWISALRVHPEYRRSGIAMSMMKWADEYARSLSLHTMGGLVEAHNEPSINLFKSQGFTEKCRYLSVFGNPRVNNLRKCTEIDAFPDYLLLDWKVIFNIEYGKMIGNLEIATDDEDNQFIKSGDFFYALEIKGNLNLNEGGFTAIPLDIVPLNYTSQHNPETYEFIYLSKTI